MKLVSTFLVACGLLAAPAFAETATSLNVKQDRKVVVKDDGIWEQQCSFDFNRWVGDAYVSSVSVYTQQSWDGVVTTEVAIEGLDYAAEGCDAQTVKNGTISARVRSRGVAYAFTGDLPWGQRGDSLAAQFEDFQLPNCYRATVTTNAWCEEQQ